MGDSNKQVCRLCLEITPACECEAINESTKEILNVLMITIDFDISDNAVACNSCVDSLQDCFDFKLHCSNRLMNVDNKVNIKKEVLPGELWCHESICQDTSKICHVCMSVIEDEDLNYNTDLKDGLSLKDMIGRCFPEVDLNTVQESIICKQCLCKMKRYYEFIQACREVEQRIENYCQVAMDHGIVATVNLKDILKFKGYDMFSKPVTNIKCEVVESNANIMVYSKDVPAKSIKSEEIDIKDELDIEVETSESDQSGDCSGSGKQESSKKKQPRKIESLGKKYLCPKCPYSSNSSYRFKSHTQNHSDNEVYKCVLCLFVTNAKLSLKIHMVSHRGPTKAFRCRECPYETNSRADLVNHMTYKDKELKMYKCPLCLYSTMNRKCFPHHQRSHKEIIRCTYDHCQYETNCKKELKQHINIHKDIGMFRCDICPFKARFRVNYNSHMMGHSNEYRHSCEKCHFSTKNRRSLLKHKRLHQMDGEGKTYKCNPCSPQTKSTVKVEDHMTKTD